MTSTAKNKKQGKTHEAAALMFALSRISSRAKELNESLEDYHRTFSDHKEEFLESTLYQDETIYQGFVQAIMDLEKSIVTASKNFRQLSHTTENHI